MHFLYHKSEISLDEAKLHRRCMETAVHWELEEVDDNENAWDLRTLHDVELGFGET